MSSPCTPHTHGRRQAQQQDDVLQPVDTNNTSINSITEQLLCISISKPGKKREQTTSTPASQARPRTQRRTDAQENTPSAAAITREERVTPSRLSCLSQLQDELSCAVCLEICIRPCATPCGHAFCRSCLRQALQVKRQCPKCRSTLPPATSWQPKVNTALWNTIQLLFPSHAAQAPPPTPEVQIPAAAGGRTRTAASNSSQPRHRHMADVLAAGEAAGNVFNDVSVRQRFRPPRSASADQQGQQQTRRQQQSRIDFVMPPDLGAMLQGMNREGAAAEDARYRRTRSQAAASRTSQPSARSQQQHSQGANPFARVQIADDENEWGEFDFSILDSLASGNSTSGATAVQHSRQRARAAAARRVQSAIANDSSMELELADSLDEDQALRAAILASLNDSAAATTTAADISSSQQRRSTRRGVNSQQARPRQQRASRQLSLSLFGRMHSGSSPQQQWAAHEDVRDAELDELSFEAMDAGQQGAFLERTNSTARAPPAVADPRQTGRHLAAAAAPVVEVIDGLSELEDDDVEDGFTLLPGAASRSHQQPAGTSSSLTFAGAAAGRRRHGRARVIAEDEEDDMQLPAAALAEVTAPVAQPERIVLPGGLSHVGSQQQGSAVSRRQLHQEHSGTVSLLRDQVEQVDLTAVPSPEPQPLAARLARLGNHSRSQPAEAADRQQSGGAGMSQSPILEQVQGSLTINAPSRMQHVPAAGSSRITINHDSSSRYGAAAAATHGQTKSADVTDDDSSDDFEPATQSSGRRLTAARAATSDSGDLARAHAGRVVSGLRRGQRAHQHRPKIAFPSHRSSR